MTADYFSQNLLNWNDRADIHIRDEAGGYRIAAFLAGGLAAGLVFLACAALFGSVLWGVAQMTLLLLVIAAAIAANVLRIEAGGAVPIGAPAELRRLKTVAGDFAGDLGQVGRRGGQLGEQHQTAGFSMVSVSVSSRPSLMPRIW